MGGSMRRRLKSEITRGCNLDDAVEGTATRTRPLSYDEIMLKRKGKKELEGLREEAREVKSTRSEGTVTSPAHHSRVIDLDVMKTSRAYTREDSSRWKEEISRVEDAHGKSKKESRDVEDRSKHKHDKDVRNDSRGRGRGTHDEYSRDDTRYDNEKRRHRDSVVQDRYVEERSRGAPERKNKRKDRSGEGEKYRVRDQVKKHDSGNRRDSETSERKEKMDLSRSHRGATRLKRRRSRSQEHVKDKGGRSRSRASSPNKTRKNVSAHDHDHDHAQLSLHSQKDKSGHNSDIASHHRRHGASSSGLGGYSPRKRKTEAAIKTPSPIRSSPERKSSSVADGNLSASVDSAPQLLSQTKSSNMSELAAGISVSSSIGKPLSAILSSNLSALNATSFDSIQLTQATRPMRRLYIDNVPASASEKDVMECFNEILLSCGANHIRGTHPCISCMIHKEKGQALVEFLTPEDASAALSFDGRSLFGSVVKIRRPKDFVEVTFMPAYNNNKNRNKNTTSTQSGSSERSKHGDDAISDNVMDSPHKIFIGGIAEGVSSKMIMEIVSAFGPLKAYNSEFNADLNERCVFIEYSDQSVTLKACAGLNDMKLGGRVLTVAQAVPNTSSMGNSANIPFVGIPEHVKPLLETPTPFLKLSNVLDQRAMNLLSETDREEIVEDIRLECSRFGSIVSINVVKTSNILGAISETREVTDDTKPLQPLEERDSGEHPVDGESVVGDHVEVGAAGRSTIEEIKENDKIAPHNCDDGDAANHPQESDVATDENMGRSDGSDVNHQEVPAQESEVKPELYHNENKDIEQETPSAESVPELVKTSDKLEDVGPVANYCAISNEGATENGIKDESVGDIHDMFAVGCVVVEFKRSEASCMAAHCLHGRVFDDRIVTVQYVPLNAYRAKFPG